MGGRLVAPKWGPQMSFVQPWGPVFDTHYLDRARNFPGDSWVAVVQFLRSQRPAGEASVEAKPGRNSSQILLQTTLRLTDQTYWSCGKLVAM